MPPITSSFTPATESRTQARSENRLLRSLPADLQRLLQPDLETVNLRKDDVLLRTGEEIEYVYFPTDSLISLIVTLENGNSIEAAIVGNDGFAGLSALLGIQRADTTGMVQIAGEALRIKAVDFRRQIEDSRLRQSLGTFAAKTFANTSQSAACIAFHPVQERLARWLLMVHDATERDEFPLTHDFIAMMLGTHRPTVTIAIRLLVTAGLIQHSRGRITIIDSDGLAQAACECYRLPRWSNDGNR